MPNSEFKASLKRDKIQDKRRKALMEHFRSMDHNRLVSFLHCWLTNKEVKDLCEKENVKVK